MMKRLQLMPKQYRTDCILVRMKPIAQYSAGAQCCAFFVLVKQRFQKYNG